MTHPPFNEPSDMEALREALEIFNSSNKAMEEAFRRLEERVHELDQELDAKNRELAFNTEYLQNLLDSISDGVMAVDCDGVVTRFNRAAAAILGYAPEEVQGHAFEAVFERPFIASPAPGLAALRAKSGRNVPVNERNSPIADHAGKRLGAVKTFEDLSEVTALREQVRQKERLAAIGEMAATVAHEIRNPLGGIRGFASFLADDIPEDDPRRRLVNKILEGATSLERVVSELLEYTRPVELMLGPVSCVELVSNALAFLEYAQDRIHIETDLTPELKALADAGKIRQVLLNILLNAAQSIADSGSIHIGTHADESWVAIAIADTGGGIEPELLPRIFSPFFTTKEKGTGLGLAVCAKIVEGHGGRIEAVSAPGTGTTVTVYLPRTE